MSKTKYNIKVSITNSEGEKEDHWADIDLDTIKSEVPISDFCDGLSDKEIREAIEIIDYEYILKEIGIGDCIGYFGEGDLLDSMDRDDVVKYVEKYCLNDIDPQVICKHYTLRTLFENFEFEDILEYVAEFSKCSVNFIKLILKKKYK